MSAPDNREKTAKTINRVVFPKATHGLHIVNSYNFTSYKVLFRAFPSFQY